MTFETFWSKPSTPLQYPLKQNERKDKWVRINCASACTFLVRGCRQWRHLVHIKTNLAPMKTKDHNCQTVNEMWTHTKCNKQINNKKKNKNLLLRCFLGHSVIFGLGQPWLTSRSWWQGVTRIITLRIFLIYCALYLSLWWVFNGGQPLLKELKKKNGNKKRKWYQTLLPSVCTHLL